MRQNSVGSLIEMTVTENGVALDISAATCSLTFKKPDGTTIEREPFFETDGQDGVLQYITIDGDLDQSGLWRGQLSLVFPDGSWPTDPWTFVVDPNIF